MIKELKIKNEELEKQLELYNYIIKKMMIIINIYIIYQQ